MAIGNVRAVEIFKNLIENPELNDTEFIFGDLTVKGSDSKVFKALDDTVIINYKNRKLDILKSWAEGFSITNPKEEKYKYSLVCQFGALIGYDDGLMIVGLFPNFTEEQWKLLFKK
jgi:hypothetical protein